MLDRVTLAFAKVLRKTTPALPDTSDTNGHCWRFLGLGCIGGRLPVLFCPYNRRLRPGSVRNREGNFLNHPHGHRSQQPDQH
jgi:hypothetical protein